MNMDVVCAYRAISFFKIYRAYSANIAVSFDTLGSGCTIAFVPVYRYFA